MTDKVVVTGVGVVSAIGIGKAETLQSLLNAKTGIGQVRYLHTEHNDMPVGEVKLSNEELMARVEVAEDEGKQQSRNAMIARLALRFSLLRLPSKILNPTVMPPLNPQLLRMRVALISYLLNVYPYPAFSLT